MSKAGGGAGRLPALAGRVGNLSELSDRARRMVQRLPGGEFALERVAQVERDLLRGLKQRLDSVEPPRLRARRENGESGVSAGATMPANAKQLLGSLLERSQEQSREAAEEDLFLSVLHALVPDEVRILSALSDGSHYPLLQLVESGLVGGGARVVVDNVSNVGKSAGVQLPAMTAMYITRLRSLGLLDLRAEDPQLKMKYEILESDEVVRKEQHRIERETWRKGNLVRQTIVISELGRALWQHCKPDE